MNFGPFAAFTMHVLVISTFAIGSGANVILVIFAFEDVYCRAFKYAPY